jgi:hypothetical protein
MNLGMLFTALIGRGTGVIVQLQPDMLAILDQWIAAQPKPTATQMDFVNCWRG